MILTKRNKILLFLVFMVFSSCLGAYVRERTVLNAVKEAISKRYVDRVSLEGCEEVAISVNNQLYNCEHELMSCEQKAQNYMRFIYENCQKK